MVTLDFPFFIIRCNVFISIINICCIAFKKKRFIEFFYNFSLTCDAVMHYIIKERNWVCRLITMYKLNLWLGFFNQCFYQTGIYWIWKWQHWFQIYFYLCMCTQEKVVIISITDLLIHSNLNTNIFHIII